MSHMPKPTSKTQMLAEIKKEHNALNTLIQGLSPAQMTDPLVGDWSAKDVLAHLIEWAQMCLGWYAAGKRGETPPVPAEGYNWRQLPELNQKIYEKHRERSVSDILKEFERVHQQMLTTLQDLPETELFAPKQYPWTRDNLLASYFISATSSHYRWARNEIRKGLKALS